MSDDYAGADYSEAESELGRFEDEMEVSGYDAVTTTQAGMRMDDFLKESGMTIDTVGEARKAQEHSKKENEKAADAREAIREVFSRAHQHPNDHEYEFGDIKITHGELKKAMEEYNKGLKDKLKKAKTPEEAHQIHMHLIRMEEIKQRMEEGKLSDEDRQYLLDTLETDDDFRYIVESAATGSSIYRTQEIKDEISARRLASLDNPDLTVANDFNPQASTDTFDLEDFGNQNILVAQSNYEKPSNADAPTHAPPTRPANMDLNDFNFG